MRTTDKYMWNGTFTYRGYRDMNTSRNEKVSNVFQCGIMEWHRTSDLNKDTLIRGTRFLLYTKTLLSPGHRDVALYSWTQMRFEGS